jgi:hypothetical protein
MGKTQRFVSYRLIFGRFLENTTAVVKLENLTERRFRGLWKATKGTEHERFEQVLTEAHIWSVFGVVNGR